MRRLETNAKAFSEDQNSERQGQTSEKAENLTCTRECSYELLVWQRKC